MSQNLTVGIIGCGVIAPTHIESYQSIDTLRVKWVCDLIDERTRELAERYNIPSTTLNYMDVLNDPEVDCISICTDHKSHAEIAVSALRAGKHVLCEKPLASSVEGMQVMLSVHKEMPDLVFAAVFQHRFDQTFKFIRECISDGTFGTVTAVNLVSFVRRRDSYYKESAWRGTWDGEGGSLLINQSIHYIDMISWLCGGIHSVCARYENITHGDSIETEDTAAIILRFKNGALGSVTATSSSSENWRNEISISGTKGYLRTRSCFVEEVSFSSKEQQERVELQLKRCQDEKTISANKDYYGNGHPAQVADFINAIIEKKEIHVTVESAADTVKLIKACYESSKTGGWVIL